MTTLGSALRIIRGSRSQASIASLFGKTQVWWSFIERGINEPSVRDLEILSRDFALSLVAGNWLVADVAVLAEETLQEGESTVILEAACGDSVSESPPVVRPKLEDVVFPKFFSASDKNS